MIFRTYMDLKIPKISELDFQELKQYISEVYEYLYRLGKNYNNELGVKINPLLMHESVRMITFGGVVNQEAQNALMQIQMDYFSPADMAYQQIIVNESWDEVDFAFKRFLMGLKEIDNDNFEAFLAKTIDYYIAVAVLNGNLTEQHTNYIEDLIDNLTY